MESQLEFRHSSRIRTTFMWNTVRKYSKTAQISEVFTKIPGGLLKVTRILLKSHEKLRKSSNNPETSRKTQKSFGNSETHRKSWEKQAKNRDHLENSLILTRNHKICPQSWCCFARSLGENLVQTGREQKRTPTNLQKPGTNYQMFLETMQNHFGKKLKNDVPSVASVL